MHVARSLCPPWHRPAAELSDGVQLGQLEAGNSRISSLLTAALTSTDAAQVAQALKDLEVRGPF